MANKPNTKKYPKSMRRSVPDMGKPAFDVRLTKAADVMSPVELSEMNTCLESQAKSKTPTRDYSRQLIK